MMTNRPPTLLAIIGPTASGKSFLAIHLAQQFCGEVINCDSIQMYRFFNLGSGKLSEIERTNIPHHLIDVLDPQERFAAGEYARLARETITLVETRGRLPIIVGGTGFYLRALVDGLFPGPTRNPELRHRLQMRASQKGTNHLHRLLRRLDPALAANIHPHDTPKTIRGIEVCLQSGRPMSELFQQGRQALKGYQILKLGLNPPRAELYERINERTRCMFKRGLVDEVRNLLAQGVPKSAPPFQSHGYREALDYLDEKVSLEAAIELAATNTRHYAKRQMTWFHQESDVRWFSGFGTDPQLQKDASEYVLRTLTPSSGQNQD